MRPNSQGSSTKARRSPRYAPAPCRRHAQHRGVVRRVQADQHVVALDRLNLAQGARQHGRPDLGAAPAAAHGQRGNGLRLFFRFEGIGAAASAGLGHRRKRAEAQHEAAVDPVLPAPHPVTPRMERAARGDGVLVAGADQASQRRCGGRLSAAGRAACGAGCRPGPVPCARRNTPAFSSGWPIMAAQSPAGENQRIGFGLQRLAHPDEAGLVERQAGVGQPGCAASLGHPDRSHRLAGSRRGRFADGSRSR